jgi:hypothetical protein
MYAPRKSRRRRVTKTRHLKEVDIYVENMRERIDAGDPLALLDAVELYVSCGTVMPTWLSQIYLTHYGDWRWRFRARTLDAAFGVAGLRKGRKLSKARKREELKAPVVLTTLGLHKKTGLPIGNELFERVGSKFKIGLSTARDLFYAADNPWRPLVLAWLKNPKFRLLDQ